MPLSVSSLVVIAMVLSTVAGFCVGRRRSLRERTKHQDAGGPGQDVQCRVAEPRLPAPEETGADWSGPPSRTPALDALPAKLATDGKIMIVDDEPINIKLAEKYLRLAGFQHIIGVSDSRTVLPLISREPPDVVLLDIMMPEVSGLQILEQLRAGQQWTYLPVIVVTASDNEQTRVQALELGANDFLGKPVNGTELVPRVRNALLVKAHHDYLQYYCQELELRARELQAQIAQARIDSLTGLANRRALDDELQRRFAECQRSDASLSVMILDVDHFKDLNDTHGHRTGDEALRVLAGVLRRAMRQVDLVARYGGEEFFVILPGTTIDDARLVAERTRQDVNRTVFRYDGKDLSVTVSIGVAELAPSEHVARTVRRADHAMYAAKKAGRNRTYWHDGRAVHPILEEPTPTQPVTEGTSPSRLSSPLGATELVPAAASTRPPAACETPASTRREGLDYAAFECDRTAFFWYISQRIAEWKRGGESFCVLLVQVGQEQGEAERPSQPIAEEVLRRTTRCLSAVVRDMDVISRYDGDCVGVLLSRTALDEGLLVAERVRQAMAAGNLGPQRRSSPFGWNVGVAEVGEGDDPVRLLQRATAAMAGEACACAGGDRGQR
jgi:diguanylate cyclase (GGDEF)-like protein